MISAEFYLSHNILIRKLPGVKLAFQYLYLTNKVKTLCIALHEVFRCCRPFASQCLALLFHEQYLLIKLIPSSSLIPECHKCSMMSPALRIQQLLNVVSLVRPLG